MGLYRDSYLHDVHARTFVSCSCNQIFTQIPSAKQKALYYVTYLYICILQTDFGDCGSLGIQFIPFHTNDDNTFSWSGKFYKNTWSTSSNSLKYFGKIWILEQYFIFPTLKGSALKHSRRYWVDPKSYQSNNFLVWEKFLTLSHLARLLAPGKRIKICQDHSTLAWFQNLSIPFTQVIFAKPQTEEKGEEGPRIWTSTELGLRG